MPGTETEDTILNSVKTLVDIPVSLDVFDNKLIMLTNSVTMTLDDLGVGPEGGFSIDSETKWSDYISVEEEQYFSNVRTFVGLSVRMVFDPPDTGPLLTALEKQIDQMQWRLNVRYENRKRAEANGTA